MLVCCARSIIPFAAGFLEVGAFGIQLYLPCYASAFSVTTQCSARFQQLTILRSFQILGRSVQSCSRQVVSRYLHSQHVHIIVVAADAKSFLLLLIVVNADALVVAVCAGRSGIHASPSIRLHVVPLKTLKFLLVIAVHDVPYNLLISENCFVGPLP